MLDGSSASSPGALAGVLSVQPLQKVEFWKDRAPVGINLECCGRYFP